MPTQYTKDVITLGQIYLGDNDKQTEDSRNQLNSYISQRIRGYVRQDITRETTKSKRFGVIKRKQEDEHDTGNSRVDTRRPKINTTKSISVIKGGTTVETINRVTKEVEDDIITRDEVIEMLIACKLRCHHCFKQMPLISQISRDEDMWTLDRIDNQGRHTRDNSVIACLACNLERGDRDMTRYLKYKNTTVTKNI